MSPPFFTALIAVLCFYSFSVREMRAPQVLYGTVDPAKAGLGKRAPQENL